MVIFVVDCGRGLRFGRGVWVWVAAKETKKERERKKKCEKKEMRLLQVSFRLLKHDDTEV